MSDIEQCEDLINQLGDEFKDEDKDTSITTSPQKILQISTMALWAVSTGSEKIINLGLPSIKSWLKNLAANGPGPAEEKNGVRYKFVKRKLTNMLDGSY